jgi:hypothetical protein
LRRRKPPGDFKFAAHHCRIVPIDDQINTFYRDKSRVVARHEENAPTGAMGFSFKWKQRPSDERACFRLNQAGVSEVKEDRSNGYPLPWNPQGRCLLTNNIYPLACGFLQPPLAKFKRRGNTTL